MLTCVEFVGYRVYTAFGEEGGLVAIRFSPNIKQKLADKHNVVEAEVIQCFANRSGNFLEDVREDHKTDPATLWFVSDTDMGRTLKVVFVPVEGDYYIKTAYVPEDEAVRIYDEMGK